MAELVRRPLSRARTDVTGQEGGRVARTVDRPRAEWEGLFVEPDWPPEDDAD